MVLDKKDIQNLADLAKLKLSGREIRDYARQLDKVLAYFGKIKKLKLNQVKESLSGADERATVWRQDQPKISDTSLLQQANMSADGYVVAPNVFKK
ncbi:MAG: Asp-tRNA(Asn)/Glu-tRNA(Gln) amidotransferase subunit GatC [Patescibacteria group bacterium]